MTHILALDISGMPFRWLTTQRAAYYVAAGKVAWAIGEPALTMRGGIQRTGVQSQLVLPPVIALAKSEAMVRHQSDMPLGDDNGPLFRRDRHMCAYCGMVFRAEELTRDHIFPKSRGGKDTFSNTCTACQPCNSRKDCRTPDEAGMSLIYLPYQPTRSEHFLLTGRRILADQMQYLIARLPQHSRLLNA